MRANETLQVHSEAAFTLRCSADECKTVPDTKSTANSLQIDYVDLADVILHARLFAERVSCRWSSEAMRHYFLMIFCLSIIILALVFVLVRTTR
jgi:hypothetical protein